MALVIVVLIVIKYFIFQVLSMSSTPIILFIKMVIKTIPIVRLKVISGM